MTLVPPSDDDDLLDSGMVGVFLGIETRSAYYWLRRNGLKRVRRGTHGRHLFRHAEVMEVYRRLHHADVYSESQ